MNESDESLQEAQKLWSWEGHSQDQAQRLAQLTADQRLEWMDAMLDLFSDQIIARRKREAVEFGYQF